jgi:hypothetical protein
MLRLSEQSRYWPYRMKVGASGLSCQAGRNSFQQPLQQKIALVVCRARIITAAPLLHVDLQQNVAYTLCGMSAHLAVAPQRLS